MKIYEHNIETGEAFERDMTASELAQWEADKTAAEIAAAAAAQAESDKLALLEKLGITEAEAKLLLQ
jgi:hypothetical protein